MLNSGIGPVITKKKNLPSGPQKKTMSNGPISMYSLQLQSQNKMPNHNMQMPSNGMSGMKSQDPSLSMQQMQTSTLKIENVSMQTGKKVGPHFMVKQGMISSPNLSQTSNQNKDLDIRTQMPSNPIINMPMQPNLQSMNSITSTGAGMPTGMKGNEKELGKPSEITTSTLRIGSNKFSKDCKIVTKIVFTKRQFVWEVAEVGSPMKGGDDDGKGWNKRKFELRFSDIEKIDVNTDNNFIRIESKEKPTEFKEHNTNLKKSAQWVKESAYDTESEFGEDESKSGLTMIDATYAKETLTKSVPGKLSHLDKLKRCELPLLIDGKSVIDSVPSTPLKTSSINLGLPGDPFSGMPTTPQLHSSHSISQILPFTSQKKDLQYPDFSLQHQNSLHLSHKDSSFPMDLTTFQKEPSKMAEEEAPAEGEEDDEDNEFPPLNKERKAEIRKFEGSLKNMKYDDKVHIIMETIKPKKFGIAMQSKKIFKCPLYKCGFTKTSVALLKTHLTQKHKRIIEKGFSIDETGAFAWKPELVDFALMVAKIYPKFVKNIIREAKKMP